MAIIPKSDLKNYFNTGDKPTEAQFGDLIDSFLHADSSEFTNISTSGTISASNLISTTSSLGYIQPTDETNESIFVSGNLIPVTDGFNFTSSLSLGSFTAAWKDLFVSEDSIKFVKKNPVSGQPLELARISIDDTGPMGKIKFVGESGSITDNSDMELRQVQFGKSPTKGATINDGGGNLGTFIGMFMQHREGDIKGGAIVNRPEMQDLGYLGRDFVAHMLQAKGSGSLSMLIDADGTNNNESFFRVEQAAIPGAGSKLFTVKKGENTFHGSNNLLNIENQVKSTGGSVIEEGVIVQPGVISQSLNIGTTTSPSVNIMDGVGDSCFIRIAEGVSIRVHNNSVFKIQCLQPDVAVDTDNGTITISDPDVVGNTGDITIFPNNGGNPTIIQVNTTIPANQVSYWTVGNIPGTYTTTGANPTDSIGIQIGANQGAVYNGIFINGEEITPAFPQFGTNVKLRIEEGAQLHIQSETQVTPTEDGTNITGTTTFEVQDEGSIVDISGSEGITLNVSGGDTSLSGNSGSFGYTNLELFGYELSMDIEQGGFFGLAVSGSTAALNNHNAANFNLPVYVSSSLEITGSLTVSGSDTFTNHGPFNNIGNISASGNLTANGGLFLGGASIPIISNEFSVPTISSSNDLILNVDDDIFIMHKGTTWVKFENPEREVEITGRLNVEGNVTASGNMFIGGDLTVDNITLTGSGTVIGGTNTKLALFNDDYWQFFANNSQPSLTIQNLNVIVNENGHQIDFRVEGDNDTHLLFTDASADKVAIGTDTVGNSLLTVDGDITLTHITSSGNISSSREIIASSLNLPNITSAAATDASHYSINGKRVEVRSQLQSGVAADSGWTLELRNTSIAANSLIVANIISGSNGAIITGSVVSANVVAANTASLNFYNIGVAIPDDSTFTASIAIF